jgi:hypothetical protein
MVNVPPSTNESSTPPQALSTPGPPKSPALLRVPASVTNAAGILSRRPDLTKSFLASNNHRFHSTLSGLIREMVAVRCRGRPSDRS